MYCYNLRIKTKQGKLLSRALAAGMIFLLALSLSCAEDAEIVTSEDFDFNGTYIMTRITRTFDGVNYAVQSPPSVGGILQITGAYYHLEITLSQEFEEDNGKLYFSEGILFFTSDDGDIDRHGTYDLENRTLTVTYTLGDYLYSETWKLADPVPVTS